MTDVRQARLSRAAVLALLLGLASIPLFFLAGIPALFVGLRALRRINASDGAVEGRGLAVAGMALGLFGCLLSVLGGAALGLVHLQERALRAGCIDHQRQVGLAINKYLAEYDTYPLAGTPGPGLPPEKRTSWQAAILPYLGTLKDEARAAGALPGPQDRAYQELAARVQPKRAWDGAANAEALNATVRAFVCPAHPAARRRPRPALTTYPGLAGIDPEAAFLPAEHPRAGIFGYSRPVGRDDLRAGTSYTMLAVESARDNGPWLAATFGTVRGAPPAEERYLGVGRPFGGLHQGGAYVLWADGSVRWLADLVPPADFRAQATLAGK